MNVDPGQCPSYFDSRAGGATCQGALYAPDTCNTNKCEPNVCYNG